MVPIATISPVKNPLWEAAKVVLRWAVFFTLGIIVDGLLVALQSFTPIPQAPAGLQVIIVLGVQNLLTGWDRYIHTNADDPRKGLVNF
jgi:hypothetical protein